ncbi:MAG: hypothetical protein GPJ54_12710 [Candidatus Heimdallarchaeota archaeon]|nr:hypothetical protein [Candidatus Heimdallarchaeota archaeon]
MKLLLLLIVSLLLPTGADFNTTLINNDMNPSIGGSDSTSDGISFIGLTPQRDEYLVGSNIMIRYAISRNFDGIFIQGHGLATEIVSLEYQSTDVDIDIYGIIFQISSYTTFKALAWTGSMANNISEQYPSHDGFHQIFTNLDTRPILKNVNASLTSQTNEGNQYYADLDSSVTISYTMNATSLPEMDLYISESKDEIYNADPIAMDRFEENGYIFNTTITIETRELYFGIISSHSTELTHRIYTGFSHINFTVLPHSVENRTTITNIDVIDISFGVANETDISAYSINATQDNTAISKAVLFSEYKDDLQNNSIPFYNVSLPTFSAGIIRLDVFYMDTNQIEGLLTTQIIEVVTSTPIAVFDEDLIYTMNSNMTVDFVASDGLDNDFMITNVSLYHIFENEHELVNFNTTYHYNVSIYNSSIFLDMINSSYTGKYTLNLLVTNELNQTANDTLVVVYDVTPPSIDYTHKIHKYGDYFELEIEGDLIDLNTPLSHFDVDWGDGIAIRYPEFDETLNVSRYSFSIKRTLEYGNYTVMLNATDVLGNIAGISIVIRVNQVIVEVNGSEFLWYLGSVMIVVIIILIRYMKRKR